MQDDSGLKRLLASGWLYSGFQRLAGAWQAQEWLAANVWKCQRGDKVVDVGCGTGDTIRHLPSGVHYVGFDVSEQYIRVAQKRFGPRGEFLVGTATTFLNDSASPLVDANIVLCNGVLHHLGDGEAVDVFRLAAQVLHAGGRLVCIEPTFLAHQGRLSTWVQRRDRGKNIRTDEQWVALARSAFAQCSARVVTGLLALPYVHIVLECRAAV